MINSNRVSVILNVLRKYLAFKKLPKSVLKNISYLMSAYFFDACLYMCGKYKDPVPSVSIKTL